MKSIEQQTKGFMREPVVVVVALCIAVWTGLVGFSLLWNLRNLNDQQIKHAIDEARANWNKDQAFRRWATKLGGIYVKPTPSTPPNPYLKDLDHRDVVTTDGMKLTLMNPAYMMRQMTQDFEDLYGIKGKITGKKVLNPINKPDEWELRALEAFAKDGEKEIYEQAQIDGKPYLRYMKPMYMTKGCVACHGASGFKEGDLRGGVSVSIPLTPYFEAAEEIAASMRVTHASVWLIGVMGFLGFGAYEVRRKRDRDALMSRVRHNALYDTLTDLPNRLLFSDRLSQAMAKQARDADYKYAVCFVDLDRFKNINDSAGHVVGDKLLVAVARRFKQFIRPSDTVARLGGDEFTFLLDDIAHAEEAMFISERLLDALKEPFEIDGQTVRIDASAGLCIGDPRYDTPEEIIRDADTAMYRAKFGGRGQVALFDPTMHTDVKLAVRIEYALREALEKEQLESYFQPIINIQTGYIAGFEALVRWKHPELGQIPPDIFIPIAEDTGMIHAIGEWMLLKACRQVKQWNLEYPEGEPFFVTVNFSARQVIRPDFVSRIREILERTAFDPNDLHCELTETLLISDQKMAEENMNIISDMGIHVSADDFGTGYSSLTYLQKFNFDTIKIDREFIQDMTPQGKGLELVRTLLTLARYFQLSVIAEGVETQEQFERLKLMRCALAQGYYLCPPLPARQIEALLQAGCHRSLDTLLYMRPGPPNQESEVSMRDERRDIQQVNRQG